jgi:pimeloyl-ACP methyl ester carboxylesterase
MHPKLLPLLLAILLTACSSPTPSPTPTSPPAPTIAPTQPAPTTTAAVTPTRVVPPVAPTTLPTPSQPVPLNLNARDGAALAAMYYPPIVRPAPGVLLLHMLGGSKADWDTFAKELQKQGYAALALDLRGHGDSAKPTDWTKAPDDVLAAYQVLSARPEVDRFRTGIVGASIGSNLALMVGSSNPNVVAVVALSPGLDYEGLNPSSSMPGFGERLSYLVASRDDAYSFSSIDSLDKLSISASTLKLETAGHGTAMLTNDPTLTPTLIEWLNKNLRDILKG